jgi:hypothetical protein
MKGNYKMITKNGSANWWKGVMYSFKTCHY